MQVLYFGKFELLSHDLVILSAYFRPFSHAFLQPDEPTPNLKRFFEACDKDVTESITERVKNLVTLITLQLTSLESKSEEDSFDEKPRLYLGVKLYYRLLEAMLLAEEARLGHNK